MAVYTRPHKRKIIKRSRTLPVYGEGDDKGKYFRCWNCGFVCNVDRDELGDSESSAGDEHTDYHQTHHCSTYDSYDGVVEPIGPELVNNASFETGDPPADWEAGNSADLDRHADPNTGTYCLEVNENGADYPYAYQVISVEEGEQYELSVYIKQGTGVACFIYIWDNQNAIAIVSDLGTATGSYVQHQYPFSIRSGCSTVAVALYHYVTSGTGTNVLFDDVSLRKILSSPRPASKYAVLGGDTGHYQVAQNIVTPDGEAKFIRHEFTSDVSRGCPFCGSTNWRGDY